MPDFSNASRLTFSLGAMEAEHLGSEFLGTEHLFLGLCKMEDILHLEPQNLGIAESLWPEIKQELSDFISYLTGQGFEPKIARRRLRKILAGGQAGKRKFSGHRTPECRKAFTLAEKIADKQGSTEVNMRHFLSAVLELPSVPLDQLFMEMGIHRKKLVTDTTVSNGKKRAAAPPEENCCEPPKASMTPYLDRYGRDLINLARADKLDPLIGRRDELKKVARILVQKKKNNPILVGDAGVGKTCVVEGLASLVASPVVPDLLKDLQIIELNMGSLVAGTKYRGEFEERLEKIVEEVSLNPNLVLFVDEIHTLIGAGSADGAPLDAANILKPALARGDIKCIGATTTAEYRRYIEKDPALERRFQPVWINEPTPEEAGRILSGLAPGWENYYGIKLPGNVITRAIELSVRYLPDLRLPDKAIDIIDQACAALLLKTFTPSEQTGRRVLSPEDVARVVAERCRIPLDELTKTETERLYNMEKYLRQRVMGQDKAIEEIAETIRAARVGMKNPNRPMAVFLFTGSTGTGKTELAKALAEFLFHDENRLIRFDMSEYQEKHGAAKLIGSPPGYVGHEEEGQLTGKVRSNPYSVLLFDEVEKAHPDVFDLLLQIFDDGRLTDSHGRLVSFAETIIIMTSNLGSAPAMAKRAIGLDINKFKNGKTDQEEQNESNWRKTYEEQINVAVRGHFRSEFINRLTKTVVFYPLDKAAVSAIIDKILAEANKRLLAREIVINLSDSAKEYLMDRGYSRAYGAREMERVFARCINEPLARMILSKEVKAGVTVFAVVMDGKLGFAVRQFYSDNITI